MSLTEEMWRYEKLTGESTEYITINRLGAFLDGVDKGIEELEKIKAEIRKLTDINPDYPMDRTIHISKKEVLEIIDKHISELKGESNE